jgi:hypothetical protein
LDETVVEETVGFEPTGLLHPPVFRTGALIRSCHVSVYFEERAGLEPASPKAAP